MPVGKVSDLYVRSPNSYHSKVRVHLSKEKQQGFNAVEAYNLYVDNVDKMKTSIIGQVQHRKSISSEGNTLNSSEFLRMMELYRRHPQ